MNKNSFKQVWGTSHFPSREAALRYYQNNLDPNMDRKDIVRKVALEEITIGRPVVKSNEFEVFLDQREERYYLGQKI